MLLDPGEQFVFSGHVRNLTTGGMGKLTLTDRRLVFEVFTAHGLFGGVSTDLVNVIGVDGILDVEAYPRSFGDPVLKVRTETRDYRFSSKSAARMSKAIAETRTTAVRRAQAPFPPLAPPVRSPPSAAQTGPVSIHLPPSPPPQVFLHCRMCGSLNSAGGGTRCASCGAAL